MGWHGHCPSCVGTRSVFRLWSDQPAWRHCSKCRKKVIIMFCDCKKKSRRRMRERF